MLHFNFNKAHIAGSVNKANDFLCRLGIKVTESVRLKNWEGVQTAPSEVKTSDVADEEQFFSTQADAEDETGEQKFERKEQSRLKYDKMGC